MRQDRDGRRGGRMGHWVGFSGCGLGGHISSACLLRLTEQFSPHVHDDQPLVTVCNAASQRPSGGLILAGVEAATAVGGWPDLLGGCSPGRGVDWMRCASRLAGVELAAVSRPERQWTCRGRGVAAALVGNRPCAMEDSHS